MEVRNIPVTRDFTMDVILRMYKALTSQSNGLIFWDHPISQIASSLNLMVKLADFWRGLTGKDNPPVALDADSSPAVRLYSAYNFLRTDNILKFTVCIIVNHQET